jgi:hypothetical protein
MASDTALRFDRDVSVPASSDYEPGHSAWFRSNFSVSCISSARPQVIERDTNPLYHDILAALERYTALPVLVNTSFNVHEEPIVNKPPECVKALLDGRVDFVVTTRGIYERTSAGLMP